MTEMFRLGDLERDAANIRTYNKTEDPLLMSSMQAVGMLIPMLGRRGINDTVLIFDGGRRLASLKKMLKLGMNYAGEPLTEDTRIPVQVVADEDADDTTAVKHSLVASIRKQLHLAEIYMAIRTMHDMSVSEDQIRATFDLSEKKYQQIMALGALDQKVLDAWFEGRIEDKAVELLTMTVSKKEQREVLDRLLKFGNYYITYWMMKRELNIDTRGPNMLESVGYDYAIENGVKIEADLFGGEHRVLNFDRLSELFQKKVDEHVEQLLAQGWGWVEKEQNLQGGRWNYVRAEPIYAAVPTEDQAESIAHWDAVLEDDNASRDDHWQAEKMLHKIKTELAAASFTSAEKAKLGCIVSSANGHIDTDYGLEKPAAAKQKKKNEADKKQEEAGNISNALASRVSESLTVAVSHAVKECPGLAIPLFIAAAQGNPYGSVIRVRVGDNGPSVDKTMPLSDALPAALKLGVREQKEAIAELMSRAVDFRVSNSDADMVGRPDVKALIDQLPPKVWQKHITEQFDREDYFKSIAVSQLKDALKDVGVSPPRDAKKATLVMLCLEHCGIDSGWLPVQLRTVHYTGPGAGS